MLNKIKAALFGFSVGDALGVPVEFRSREQLAAAPLTDMRGYGTWNQPPGTWSDDSSLAFCLAESLTKGYNLQDIANHFIGWYEGGYWGAHHAVFDVGAATRLSIKRLMEGESPALAGGLLEADNGNGSLMRIMPLLFYIKDLPTEERYNKTKEVSAITHGHFRSVFACFIYLEFARNLLAGMNKNTAYASMQTSVALFAKGQNFSATELQLFSRILQGDISNCKSSAIVSSGYVLSTLEASIWCLLTTSTYSQAVLKAVNLGSDTDTTACVTGGLAGLLYGYNTIPENWLAQLARKDDIEVLCERLAGKYFRYSTTNTAS